MKYLILFFSLFLLFSCSNKVTTDINTDTASLEGTIVLQNATIDSVGVFITANLQDVADVRYTTQPNSEGYFIIQNMKPGDYEVKISFDTFAFATQTISTKLIINKKTSLGEIYFNKIEPTASIEGFVKSEAGNELDTQIDILYKTDNDTFLFYHSISPDTTGFYSFANLYPRDIKLNFTLSGFDTITKIISLQPSTATMIDTIFFENIQDIPQKQITIDGTIDSDWTPFYVNTHPSNWSDSNDFSNFYIAYTQDTLYIAVDGGFSSSENCVNIYIDKDYKDGTGINDFSQISGGGVGDHLRKNVVVGDNFGADLAFSTWALSTDTKVVSLQNPTQVNENELPSKVSLNSTAIEIAIPLNAIYENTNNLSGEKIAVVAIIGGGGDQYFADDTIPQQENAANFTSVLKMKFPEERR